MTYLSVFVPGKPAPQGSKRYLGVKGGKGITVESSKAVAPWRADIRDSVKDHVAGRAQPGDAVSVALTFVMPRPASAPKRSTPPAVKRPDVDKLARAVLDALSSAGVWEDDSQVTRLVASKRIAQIGERSGCYITVEDAADQRDAWDSVKVERTADAASGGDQ
ncbi:MAG: RusA family crossover junction endodeoxyribonuclease [Actinophytocola sp.]|uniref:RusA family crossover junction endodeoxyribonuclease n=1 Tax=Actinophytocola sp. TaxID=1872138 RepID=UPI003C756396